MICTAHLTWWTHRDAAHMHAPLSQRTSPGCSPSSYISLWWCCASQREIEKLIAVCYCTTRLIVRIHNIRVRALCENKIAVRNGSYTPAAAHEKQYCISIIATTTCDGLRSDWKATALNGLLFSTGVPINFAQQRAIFLFSQINCCECTSQQTRRRDMKYLSPSDAGDNKSSSLTRS